MSITHLANEWLLLQNQSNSYEKYSLLIKLVAIVLAAASALSNSGNELVMAALIGVLWLQDAIWKTFQQRIDARLVQLEGILASAQTEDDSTGVAYQLHTDFLAERQRGGVLKEYLAQSFRPTVAFPYAVLLLLVLSAVILA